MESVYFDITVDLILAQAVQCIKVKQYADKIPVLRVAINENGSPYIVGTGVSAKIEGTRGDGSGFMLDGTVSGSTVTVPLTKNLLNVKGKAKTDVVLTGTAGVMKTTTFIIDIEPAALQGETIEKSDAYQSIEAIRDETKGYKDVAEQAANTATSMRDQATQAANTATQQAQNAQIAADKVQAIVANNEAYTKQESDYKYTVAPRKETTSDIGEVELTDADNGLAGVSMKGNSFQYESTGKNLINIADNYNSTIYGVTVKKVDNQRLHITGTPDSGAPTAISFNVGSINDAIGGRYYSSSFNKKIKGIGMAFSGVDTGLLNITMAASASKKENVFVEKFNNFVVTLNISNENRNLDDYLCLMLNEGPTALPYEPYSGGEPGPNPDYPFPVQSVGDIPRDSNGVEIRNLLDEEWLISQPEDAWRKESSSDSTMYSIELPDIPLANLVVAGYVINSPGGLSYDVELSNNVLGAKFISNSTSKITEQDYTGESNKIRIYIRKRGTTSDSITNVLKAFNYFKLMITTASEIDEYRPFIGENNGLIKIESQGKNLFNINGEIIGYQGKTNPIIFGNHLIASGQWFTHQVINVKKDTDYTVSFDGKTISLAGSVQRVTVFDTAGKEELGEGALIGENKKFTINTKNYDSVMLMFYSGNEKRGTAEYWNIQFEEGSTATEYTPYHHSTTWVPIKEPLRKIGDVADEILKDGTVVQRIGRYNFTGDEKNSLIGLSSTKIGSFYINGEVDYFNANSNKNALCNRLIALPAGTPLSEYNFGKMLPENNGYYNFWIKNGNFSGIDEVKQILKEYNNNGNPFSFMFAKINSTVYTIPRILVETYDPSTDITVQSEIKPEMTVDYKYSINAILKRLAALEAYHVETL